MKLTVELTKEQHARLLQVATRERVEIGALAAIMIEQGCHAMHTSKPVRLTFAAPLLREAHASTRLDEGQTHSLDVVDDAGVDTRGQKKGPS